MTLKNYSNRNFRSTNPAFSIFLKTLLIIALVTGYCSMHAQTLFTYGNKAVSQQEFLKAFNKNPSSENNKKALEEYLLLYINYKLKVQHAYDHRMDTLQQQKEELENYKFQLQESFIAQKSNVEVLVNEAINRGKKDILLGHLFVGFNANDSASIKAAKTRVDAAFAELGKGKSFETVAAQFSTDPDLAATKGNVGWITVFTLPYNYETAVYNTPGGGYTTVMKGIDGFHIFRNIAERNAVGSVKIAQILLWISPQSDQMEITGKNTLADSIYQLLQQGAAFDEMAVKFSNDRSSYASGGALPAFGVGQFDPSFEEQAFALNKKNEISKPFRTSYGIHILKLLDKMPITEQGPTQEELSLIQQQVISSDRAEIVKSAFLRKSLPAMGYKLGGFKQNDLWAFSDSSLKNGITTGMPVQKNTWLFSIGSEKILAENWVLYLRGLPKQANNKLSKPYPEIWDDYLLQSANAYYLNNLEKIDPLFKEQLKEFKDANLLFEAMDQKVWTAAAIDTAGQKKYYDSHANKYKWEAGAHALMVAALDSVTAVAFKKELQQQPGAWRKIADRFKEKATADSGRFEMSQLPLKNFAGTPATGMCSEPSNNPIDNSFSFSYLFDLVAGGDSRSFEEARGWIIGDYQQLLEEKWIAALKKKYPVTINQAVWQQLLKVN